MHQTPSVRDAQPQLLSSSVNSYLSLVAFAIAALWCAPTMAARVLDAGGGHTCTVMPTGTVNCWGWQEQGQSGDGTSNYNTGGLPVEVLGSSAATAIATGYQHSCAIVAAGAVKCWGYNRWGQLGSGTGSTNAPVDVVGLTGVTDLDAGGNHSCALVDGNVWCWGHGYHGQLGTGDFIESPVPVQVTGVSGASAIATGGNHSCAIVADGAVKCWGRNSLGQLGSGSTTPDPGVHTATDVSNLSNAIAISAGDQSTCALISGGTVQCWGWGGYGQLGNNADANSPSPLPVSGIDDAVALSVGDAHACALLEGGNVACWGHNYYGQTGDGTSRNNRLVPVGVLDVADASAVAAGGSHSCAVVSQSPLNVKCWGYGNFGQLGDAQFGGTHEVASAVFVTGSTFDVIFGDRPGSFEDP